MNKKINSIACALALTSVLGCDDHFIREEDPSNNDPEIAEITDVVEAEITDVQTDGSDGAADTSENSETSEPDTIADSQDFEEIDAPEDSYLEDSDLEDSNDLDEFKVEIPETGSIIVTMDATPCFQQTADPNLCEDGWDGGNQRIFEVSGGLAEVFSANICRPEDNPGPDQIRISTQDLYIGSDGQPAMVNTVHKYEMDDPEQNSTEVIEDYLGRWVGPGLFEGLGLTSDDNGVGLHRGECLKVKTSVDRLTGDPSLHPKYVQLRMSNLKGPNGGLIDAEYGEYDGKGPLVIFELTRNLVFEIVNANDPHTLSINELQANNQDAYLMVAQVRTSGSDRTEAPFVTFEVSGVPGTEIDFERSAFSSFFEASQEVATVSAIIPDDGSFSINLPFIPINEEINGDESNSIRVKIASENLTNLRGDFTVSIKDVEFDGYSGHPNFLVDSSGDSIDVDNLSEITTELVD